MRTDVPGTNLPNWFGKANSVCKRFRQLTQKEGWGKVFDALQVPVIVLTL